KDLSELLPKRRAWIRRTIIRVVKPVVGVHSQLEADALRHPEVLAQAHVAGQEARPAKGVAAYRASEVRRWFEQKWCSRIHAADDAKAWRCNTGTHVGKVSLAESGLQENCGAGQVVS